MEEKNVNVDKLIEDLENEKNDRNDYSQLIAAQNESARKLKIRSISRDLNEEKKKRRNFAFISGICISTALASATFIDVPTAGGLAEVLQTEVNALSSYASLKEYLSFFSPATYGAALLGSISLSKYLKHRSKSNKMKADLYDMVANEPSGYLNIVEDQMNR